MATTVDELQVLVTANIASFQKQMDGVQRELGNMQNNMSKTSKGIATRAGVVAGVISSVFSAAMQTISANISSAVSRLDTLNNYSNVMAGLGVASEEASASVQHLSDKLTGLPTTLDSAASSVQRFTAVNGNIGASTDMFLAMNNAIIAGGASAQQQETAIEQLTQAYSKGTPELTEWRALQTAMPAQLKQISNAMGYVSDSALYDALKDGTVSMNDFMLKMVEMNNTDLSGLGTLEEQARNATGGVQTSFTNMKTALVRGLANIMNVIGQSNIAGFFNAVSKAIGTATNYIAAFTKVVCEAVTWVAALFGKTIKFGSSTSSLSGASSDADSLAASTGTASDNLGAASNNAKKLKKQLAGFDEMNTLTQEDSSSGSGGSGSSGGGGGVSLDSLDYEADWLDKFKDANDTVGELAKKIKNLLGQMFNFEKIGGSIKQFIDDIGAALEPIGKIIGDVWNDYLLPLVSWAGNSLLPAVLNAIGGAIRLVGTVLGAYWEKFLKPFIDSFIAPIAKFTGGIVVDVLNGIGNALRSIAQNDKAVMAVAAGIAAITAAIAASKLSSFFSTLTNGIGIFAKARDAGLTLSTAFGAVAGESSGLVGKLASLAQGGFGALQTVLTTVKGGFSSLWGVISAHPLLAIASIIGGLLLTNEEFRKSLGELVNAVLTPLQSLLGTIVDCITPILAICGSLVEILMNLIKIVITPIASLLSGLVSIIAKIVKPILEVNNALSPVYLLKPVLEGVAAAIGWISDTLSELTGFVTGAISGITGWIDSLGKSEASAEDLAEADEKCEDAAEDYTDALKRNNAAQEQSVSLASSLLDKEDNLAEKNKELAETAKEMGIKIDTNSEKYKQLSSDLQACTSDEERAKLINEAYGTSLDANDENVRNLTRSILNQTQASQDVAQATEDVAQATEDVKNEFVSSAKDMNDAVNEQVQALKDAGMNSDQLNDKLKQLSNDGSENSLALRDAIIRDAEDFGMSWDEASGKMSESADKSNEDIRDSFSDIGEWFGQKFNEAKENMSNAFSGLKQWGSDKLNKIKEGFNATKEKFETIGKNAKEALGNGMNKLKEWGINKLNKIKEGFENTKEKFKNIGEKAKSGLSNGMNKLKEWGSEKLDNIKDGFSNAKEKFKEVGKNIWDGVKNGIGDLARKGKELFSGMVDGVKDFLGIHSPSRLFKELGSFMGQGLEIGFSNEAGSLVDTAKEMSSLVNNTLSAGITNPQIDITSLANLEGADYSDDKSEIIRAIENSFPNRLVVQLGSETIVDKVITEANKLSFMKNGSVWTM